MWPWVGDRKPSLDLANAMGDDFQASLTASALKLLQRAKVPTVITCHDQRRLKWSRRSPDFSTDFYILSELHQDTIAFEMAFGSAKGLSRPKRESASRWVSGPGAYRMEGLVAVDQATRRLRAHHVFGCIARQTRSDGPLPPEVVVWHVEVHRLPSVSSWPQSRHCRVMLINILDTNISIIPSIHRLTHGFQLDKVIVDGVARADLVLFERDLDQPMSSPARRSLQFEAALPAQIPGNLQALWSGPAVGRNAAELQSLTVAEIAETVDAGIVTTHSDLLLRWRRHAALEKSRSGKA